MDHKPIGECDEAGGNVDARDAIAETIKIGSHREIRVGPNNIGRAQVAHARGMDVELKQHRGLRQALKCDVESSLDEQVTISCLRPPGCRAEQRAMREGCAARNSASSARAIATIELSFPFRQTSNIDGDRHSFFIRGVAEI